MPSNYVGCIDCDPCLSTVLNTNDSNRIRDPKPLQIIERNNIGREQIQHSSQSNTISFATSDSGYTSNISNNSECINCNCGKPASRLTVKKQGPNCGREFYGCGSEWNSNRCDFFVWVDGGRSENRTVARTNHGNAFVAASGGDSQVNCFCALPSKR